MTRGRSLGLLAAAVLCVTLALRHVGPEQPTTDEETRAQAVMGHASAPSAEPPVTEGRPPPPPASLSGTEVDGALLADTDGRFLPTPSALRLFDYFLSASGEEDPATIRARIEAEIARQLPPSAQAGARALLADHLAYREAVRSLAAGGLGEDDLETRHQRLRELRREIFGAGAAHDLFETEEQMARVALAMRRVEQDPSLSPEEKQARREALAEELPASVREANRRASLPLELSRREAELRRAGASAGEIRELREAWVGREAAGRLEALEARRNAWNRRVEAYRLERDLMLRDPGAGGAAALERLREEHFEGPELARVRALDRIEGSPPPTP